MHSLLLTHLLVYYFKAFQKFVLVEEVFTLLLRLTEILVQIVLLQQQDDTSNVLYT